MATKLIRLSNEDRDLARRFAARIERALKEQRSLGNAAAARLTSHGINERTQALAKLAEIAFCKWANLDPKTALNWDAEPDDGTDVVFVGKRWDVKHTENGRLLLWPFNKVHALELGRETKTIKRFDTFVLVCGTEIEMEIIGWCTRRFFEDNHEEAVAARRLSLTAGTLVLDRSKLRDLTELRETRSSLSALVRVCHQCNKPHDGTEREVLIGSFLRWLHPSCEHAFMSRLLGGASRSLIHNQV